MIGLSLGVRESGGPRIFVPSCSRQAIGLGSIALDDFSLTGQIPMLFRPWVHRRVVDRGGARPSRPPNIGHHTVKASSWFAPLVFLHRFLLPKSRHGHVNRSGKWSAEFVAWRPFWRLGGTPRKQPKGSSPLT